MGRRQQVQRPWVGKGSLGHSEQEGEMRGEAEEVDRGLAAQGFEGHEGVFSEIRGLDRDMGRPKTAASAFCLHLEDKLFQERAGLCSLFLITLPLSVLALSLARPSFRPLTAPEPLPHPLESSEAVPAEWP